MITYILLIIAAVSVLARWMVYHICKRKANTPEQSDAALIERLNEMEDAAYAD